MRRMTRLSASSDIKDNEGGMTCRARMGEESPDRKGHPAVESTGGSNLTDAVTENYRPQG